MMVNAVNYLASKIAKFNHNLLPNHCTDSKNFKNVLNFEISALFHTLSTFSYINLKHTQIAFQIGKFRKILKIIFTEIFFGDNKFVKLAHCGTAMQGKSILGALTFYLLLIYSGKLENPESIYYAVRRSFILFIFSFFHVVVPLNLPRPLLYLARGLYCQWPS